MIETLTYSCQDAEILTTVKTELQTSYDKIKSAIPQVEGLITRPAKAQQVKAISRKYRTRLLNSKFSELPPSKKRGRHKENAAVRKRVGRKANRLHKVTYYHNIKYVVIIDNFVLRMLV